VSRTVALPLVIVGVVAGAAVVGAAAARRSFSLLKWRPDRARALPYHWRPAKLDERSLEAAKPSASTGGAIASTNGEARHVEARYRASRASTRAARERGGRRRPRPSPFGGAGWVAAVKVAKRNVFANAAAAGVKRQYSRSPTLRQKRHGQIASGRQDRARVHLAFARGQRTCAQPPAVRRGVVRSTVCPALVPCPENATNVKFLTRLKRCSACILRLSCSLLSGPEVVIIREARALCYGLPCSPIGKSKPGAATATS
jgi:hypothetical protein